LPGTNVTTVLASSSATKKKVFKKLRHQLSVALAPLVGHAGEVGVTLLTITTDNLAVVEVIFPAGNKSTLELNLKERMV
jgi:hypothetical protein